MKALKLSLLAATLATSSLAMAQDKAALIKQFLELQRPGVEALARGLVEESSMPVARAGAGYLQTQVPEDKREAAGKAADAELKKYFDSAYPIVRDKAVQVAPAALTPVLEQNFSEEELRQLVAWINSPVSKKYQEVNPQLQAALAEKVVADTRSSIEPKLEQLDQAVAKALGAPAAPAAGSGAGARAPAAPAKKVSAATGLRPYNFSAGPAAMPEEVLREAADQMLNWHGSGLGVMEMSHRGKEFGQILAEAEADLRTLLAVPGHFHILFMQGGGLGENAIVPLNLSRGGVVDFVVTGSWSTKSHKEATRYAEARVAASNAPDSHTDVPPAESWALSDNASYVHLCSNETINGIEFQALPDLAALGSRAPLVIDFSSHVASRPVDWSRVGLAFGGAQKNIGPAGLTIVIVRDDLLGHALPICPSAFNYRTVADNQSMYNTPPTWGIYVAGLTFKWLLAQREGELTGVAAMEQRNIAKAQLLYDTIDGSAFYANRVAPAWRSRMNVPFLLRDESRNQAFLDGARDAGLLQLKGHKSVGGMRASIYNAMPLAGVQALVAYMREFERLHA